jgi:TonB-dependent SusC/RagA subfamily outer membrane receptor
MTYSSARAALSLCLFTAFAAGCASRSAGGDPDLGPIDPIEDVLRVTAPGLSVSRAPDGGIAVQVVRGPSSFYGNNEPLYLVDGTPFHPGPGGALTGVNPHDIESITLLKNPADTGIYGARGANGVVVIKTKRPPKSSG